MLAGIAGQDNLVERIEQARTAWLRWEHKNPGLPLMETKEAWERYQSAQHA